MSKIEAFEQAMREAVAKAQEQGLTIQARGFGVIQRPLAGTWDCVTGSCCPIGAYLVVNQVAPKLDAVEDCAEALGVSRREADHFWRGFDKYYYPTTISDEPFYQLGKKLRDELLGGV